MYPKKDEQSINTVTIPGHIHPRFAGALLWTLPPALPCKPRARGRCRRRRCACAPGPGCGLRSSGWRAACKWDCACRITPSPAAVHCVTMQCRGIQSIQCNKHQKLYTRQFYHHCIFCRVLIYEIFYWSLSLSILTACEEGRGARHWYS